MTSEDVALEAALKKCANAHLPDDFAARLVKRIRENKKGEAQKASLKSSFTRIALVAASLTLFLGFIPGPVNRPSDSQTEIVAHCNEVRSAKSTLPLDSRLKAIAFLGFCREAIRRRMKSFLVRSRKREEE